MNEPNPRFEFRSFRTCFDEVERRLRSITACESILESTEIYLVVPAFVHDRNLKIRDDRLEFKQLVARDRALEQWKPAGQWEFPIASKLLLDLLPEVGDAPWSDALAPELTQHDLLEVALRPETPLFRSRLFKRRFKFSVDNCPAEVDQLLLHRAAIQSVAIESEDPDPVLQLRSVLRLDGEENVPYPCLLSRIMGMTRSPDED